LFLERAGCRWDHADIKTADFYAPRADLGVRPQTLCGIAELSEHEANLPTFNNMIAD
jgi:hypothetical protein